MQRLQGGRSGTRGRQVRWWRETEAGGAEVVQGETGEGAQGPEALGEAGKEQRLQRKQAQGRVSGEGGQRQEAICLPTTSILPNPLLPALLLLLPLLVPLPQLSPLQW